MEKEHYPSLDKERTDQTVSIENVPMDRRTAVRIGCAAALTMTGMSLQESEAAEKVSKLPKLTDAKWAELVGNAKNPVVVMFSGDWCGYCHAMEPVLLELQQKYAQHISIVKMDIDHSIKDNEYRKEGSVRNVPYCVFFSRGKALYVCTGYQTKEFIEQGIINTLKKHEETAPKTQK